MTATQSSEGAAWRAFRQRLAAVFVLTSMAAGCLLLWIGAPVGGMWLAAKLTGSPGVHLAAALVLAASGMSAVAVALVWIDGLYLRITSGEAQRIGDVPVERRGPLEPMLICCLVAAVIAFLLWFLVIADNPTVNVY